MNLQRQLPQNDVINNILKTPKEKDRVNELMFQLRNAVAYFENRCSALEVALEQVSKQQFDEVLTPKEIGDILKITPNGVRKNLDLGILNGWKTDTGRWQSSRAYVYQYMLTKPNKYGEQIEDMKTMFFAPKKKS